MQKKLTITVDEEVYAGLHKVVGQRKISKFIEGLARPHVLRANLEAEYAQMALDRQREREALRWAEAAIQAVPKARTSLLIASPTLSRSTSRS